MTETELQVLVIDDDRAVRGVIVQGLTTKGLDVVGVSSAVAGLELLREQAIPVVVSDVLMPDMDGFELLAALHDLPQRPKVIMMSGGQRLEPDRYLQPAKIHGADRVIPKPFELDDLVSMIQELLAAPAG